MRTELSSDFKLTPRSHEDLGLLKSLKVCLLQKWIENTLSLPPSGFLSLRLGTFIIHSPLP